MKNGVNGKKTVTDIYRQLGLVMWDYVGMAREEKGLKHALNEIPKLKEEFWNQVRIPGSGEEFNKEIEMAGRVADFLELGELMARDALERSESCGGHFRVESQHPDSEAKRDDSKFAYAAAWEWKGESQPHQLHKENLVFENVKPSTRSYK
jgi:succinate dehydrogenase / fumarate reductase flavoprotein subunit